ARARARSRAPSTPMRSDSRGRGVRPIARARRTTRRARARRARRPSRSRSSAGSAESDSGRASRRRRATLRRRAARRDPRARASCRTRRGGDAAHGAVRRTGCASTAADYPRFDTRYPIPDIRYPISAPQTSRYTNGRMRIDRQRTASDLLPKTRRLFELSAPKIDAIERTWKPEDGAPVFTVRGRYQARGWTEWTQGFQFGSALLQFDATGERGFLDLGRSRTLERMAPHLTHVGVHDHGFNNVSTYGTLWRLAREGRFDASDWELRFYELALKVSGAVQARRWTPLPDGGFIHSFNGAHSLFVDTIRSLRALPLAHALGQRLMEEQDASVNLLDRLVKHARATARYNVYFGRGRDRYDVRGRTAHESLFNVASGTYRGPSTQQGYSPFSTWTRGLAWAMLGFAEQLEFLATLPDVAVDAYGGRAAVDAMMLGAAPATGDHYIGNATATHGIPYP